MDHSDLVLLLSSSIWKKHDTKWHSFDPADYSYIRAKQNVQRWVFGPGIQVSGKEKQTVGHRLYVCSFISFYMLIFIIILWTHLGFIKIVCSGSYESIWLHVKNRLLERCLWSTYTVVRTGKLIQWLSDVTWWSDMCHWSVIVWRHMVIWHVSLISDCMTSHGDLTCVTDQWLYDVTWWSDMCHWSVIVWCHMVIWHVSLISDCMTSHGDLTCVTDQWLYDVTWWSDMCHWSVTSDSSYYASKSIEAGDAAVPTCHVMVSMALTNQRRSRQGRNTSYGAERALDLSTAHLSGPWTNPRPARKRSKGRG